MTCLVNSLVQDGIMGPDVSLELVVSTNHMALAQSMAWLWAAACSARADSDRFPIVRLFCVPSVRGSVFSLSGWCTPLDSHHTRPRRSLPLIGLVVSGSSGSL